MMDKEYTVEGWDRMHCGDSVQERTGCTMRAQERTG